VERSVATPAKEGVAIRLHMQDGRSSRVQELPHMKRPLLGDETSDHLTEEQYDR
jgi:hypothetical protein